MRAKPAYFRDLAARTRGLAQRANDANKANHLRAVAEQYDRLAEEAEEAPDKAD